MSARSETPDLDAEQEVDLGRYWRAIVTRWWLAAAGFAIGAIIGYLISLGASQVWKATATVYLGSPYSAISSVLLVSPQTNPATVNAIVHSEEAVQQAATVAGVKPSALRGGISTKSISAGASATSAQRASANPLVRITVRVGGPRKARLAANSLARTVVEKLSPFAEDKIRYLQQRVSADKAAIDAIQRQSAGSSDATVKAVLAVNLAQLLQDQLSAQQLLAQARDVELPSVLTHAAAVKTTARSRRNSLVVGGFLGLVLGLVAALLWEPVASRRRT
jgi:Chain length determinant protein